MYEDLLIENSQFGAAFKKALKRAGFITFGQISNKTQLEFIEQVPGLKVRHLRDLILANITFKSGTPCIWFDDFINERKLFNLWQDEIYTYEQLDSVSYEQFQFYMGGPQSRFFRKKKEASAWLQEHKMRMAKEKKLIRNFGTYVNGRISQLLTEAGITKLAELLTKSDYEIAKILQPDFPQTKLLSPLTRERITKIKYALLKEGIDRPCMPL
jgi:hypothetical protein